MYIGYIINNYRPINLNACTIYMIAIVAVCCAAF